MGSFKRKSYGKVKPVPKTKEKAPNKPSVLELRSIYKRISRANNEAAQLDGISEALIWWDNAFPYLRWKFRKLLPLEAARAMQGASLWLKNGREASTNKAKLNAFVQCLAYYKRYAAPAGLKIPDLTPALKESKTAIKKAAVVNKGLAARFDKVLTLLSECFCSCPIELKVVAELNDGVARKFDHAESVMYYTRKHCNEMKSILHKKGLLYLVISEGWHIARGMSFSYEAPDGSFVVDHQAHVDNYSKLLLDFEAYSHTTKAPRSITKRDKKKGVWSRGTTKDE